MTDQAIIAFITLGFGAWMSYIALMLRSVTMAVTDIRVGIAKVEGRFDTITRLERDVSDLLDRARQLEIATSKMKVEGE